MFWNYVNHSGIYSLTVLFFYWMIVCFERSIMTQKYDHKHLSFSDRIYIEQSLYDNLSFKAIARFLEKDPTTISKEIKRSLEIQNSHATNLRHCLNYSRCYKKHLCGDAFCSKHCHNCKLFDCSLYCSNYESNHCSILDKPPYVCNGCSHKTGCRKEHHFYRSKHAQSLYEQKLRDSRTGINMTKDELLQLNDLITPLIKNGQPLSHIFATHKDELTISRQTLYNYLDAGVLDVRNIDLPRRVRYKKRKKRVVTNHDQSYRSKRTYKDFLRFMEAHPEYDVVELDTVKGGRNAGKCIMTLLFRSSSFMLLFLLDRCTQQNVTAVFDQLYALFGHNLFRNTFPVILTDNGPEFKNPNRIEYTESGKRRTFLFYCDPYVSNQKARLEKNHEFIRYVIPKGRSMYRYSQQDMTLLATHINSLARDSLNGNTPFDLAEILLNKKVLDLLELKKVSPDQVLLKPTLLK